MTSNRYLGAAALVFAAFTAACGGGDGSSGPTFPDSVSTADAEDFADGVAGYASYVADAINFGGPSIALSAPAMTARVLAAAGAPSTGLDGRPLPALETRFLGVAGMRALVRGPQATAGAGCTVTSHGFADPNLEDALDANNNGIPDDVYFKVVCVATDSVATDTVVTQTLRLEVAIKEIDGSLYGETLSQTQHVEERDNHGRYTFLDLAVSGKSDIRTDGIVDQANIKYRLEDNIGGEVEFSEFGEGWDNGFDPATPISAEAAIPNGDLTISGRRYYANSDDANLSFAVSTPTPLAYSAACAAVPTNPPFSDGTLLGKLNNSSSQASFTIDFTSCGNYTIAVDGAYDEVAAVAARR